jgi:RNA polymerase sigma-70 factor (ECF subfamily)
MQILNRRDEAEDLVQEVFLTFWKQDKFDSSRGGLSTYLSLLTRSRALNRLASHGSQQRAVERLQLHEPREQTNPTPLEQAVQTEQQASVRTALAQLPPNQRKVLELGYYQGLSQSQIAQHLNLPLGTVKTQSRQGLLKLRQLLGRTVG